MRTFTTMGLALIAMTALAAKHTPKTPAPPPEQRAYAIFDTQIGATGTTVSFTRATELYFLSAPCELPVVNAEHMRKYWYVGYDGAACWYPTLGGGRAQIYANGYMGGSPSTVGNDVECLVAIHDDTRTFTVLALPRHDAFIPNQ